MVSRFVVPNASEVAQVALKKGSLGGLGEALGGLWGLLRGYWALLGGLGRSWKRFSTPQGADQSRMCDFLVTVA